MPNIQVVNLGLNIAGTLMNNKRIMVCDNKDLSKELLQGNTYGPAAQAASIVNQFANVPVLLNATEQAQYMNIKIKKDKKLAKHPVENGTQFSDYSVVNPVTVQMDIILPGGFGYGIPNITSDSIIKEIQTLSETRTFCAIVNYSDVYRNMVITSDPPEINTKNYNRVQFSLRFEQILNPSIDSSNLIESNIKEPFDSVKKLIGKLS